ncbi:anti-sigma factor, partial [Streptomyces sparsus]
GDADGSGDGSGTGGPGGDGTDGDGTGGGPAAGTVRLERFSAPSSARVAGPAREVRIQVSGLPRTSGFFEVWLMDAAGKKLISLGVLHDDGTATLPLPPGVDIGEYSQVDVSDQAFNGSPAHSGRSVVRGSLTG